MSLSDGSSSAIRPIAGHILIVDDDPEVVESIREAAMALGRSVRTSPHGTAALDDITAHMPVLVIVAMDLALMGGLELLIRLRVRYGENAPPVVLTSRGSRPSGLRFRGVIAEVQKHLVPEKLASLLPQDDGPPSRVQLAK